MDERSDRWTKWLGEVRASLVRQESPPVPPEVLDFFSHHWTAHHPLHRPRAFSCPAMEWTLPALRARVPDDLVVEVQTGRLDDPDYERRSTGHKEPMRFPTFLDRLVSDPENAVYMTANNARQDGMAVVRNAVSQAAHAALGACQGRRPRDAAAAVAAAVAAAAVDAAERAPENPELIRLLAADFPRLPFLQEAPHLFFLWIGNGAVTPLHHDLTNNGLFQLVGTRTVRLVPPAMVHRLENHHHVYSRLFWLEEEEAAQRGISYRDHLLLPGDFLFIPVGWWHCVRSHGISMMLSATHFLWPNDWGRDFPR